MRRAKQQRVGLSEAAALCAASAVGVAIVVARIVGDQSIDAAHHHRTPDGLYRMIRPIPIAPTVGWLAVAVAVVLCAAVGARLAWTTRHGRLPVRRRKAVACFAAVGELVGLGYRVVTAGVIGANIGGGMALLVLLPAVPAVLGAGVGLLLWPATDDQRKPSSVDGMPSNAGGPLLQRCQAVVGADELLGAAGGIEARTPLLRFSPLLVVPLAVATAPVLGLGRALVVAVVLLAVAIARSVCAWPQRVLAVSADEAILFAATPRQEPIAVVGRGRLVDLHRRVGELDAYVVDGRRVWVNRWDAQSFGGALHPAARRGRRLPR